MKERFFFRRENKVTSPRQYSFLFARAKKFNLQSFSFYSYENKLAITRMGVVVAKRNQKKAVCRNRTKRIVRESFRCNQHRLLGLDIIIVARRGVDSMLAEELRLELGRAWDRLKTC